MVFCILIVRALSAPTEKSSESILADSLSQEKSHLANHEVALSISNNSTEKRDKREDTPAASSSADNKRSSALSQPDYQENKPPTFVHPVPVDQIIKNSNASPEIHS